MLQILFEHENESEILFLPLFSNGSAIQRQNKTLFPAWDRVFFGQSSRKKLVKRTGREREGEREGK